MAKKVFWTEDKLDRAIAADTKAKQRALAAELGTSAGAVRFQAAEARRRRGYPSKIRHWTEEEDALLLAARTTPELLAAAEQIGITEAKARRRMYEVRNRAGRSRAPHHWTDDELAQVRACGSAAEAEQWAIARGLSKHTARQRYFTGKSERR